MTDSTAPENAKRAETSDASQAPNGATPDPQQFEAITSQDELDRIITSRLSRERAKHQRPHSHSYEQQGRKPVGSSHSLNG